jgi:RES domain-containing protein
MAPVRFWRIAVEAPLWSAVDLTGRGAEVTGGRWNRCGTPMLYASASIALACLETLVHTQSGSLLPMNRFLVELAVPRRLWARRQVHDAGQCPGWEATPAGRASMDWGTAWAQSRLTLLADVPSVVVPEERNLLINPRHPDVALLAAKVLRRWHYDPRLGVQRA